MKKIQPTFKLQNFINNGKRDFKFGFTIIITNIVFLILNTPVSIYFILGISIELALKMVYYFYYAIEFYLQIAVNSLVRNEFLSILDRFRQFGVEMWRSKRLNTVSMPTSHRTTPKVTI